MTPIPCPSDGELQGHSNDPARDPALHEHVAGCAGCRERLELIRQDEAFLERFRALGRSLRIPQRGTHLRGCRILREVGRGSQGVVYEAEQESTRRRVALKLLSAGRLTEPRRRQRFAREIALVSCLRHPNVVVVHDSGETEDGTPFLVMEYVEGVPLTRYLRPAPGVRPTPHEVLRLFLGICAGVSHAHQKRVIHRDLKPANILIEPGGEPRIVDFGLAKALDSADGAGPVFETASGSFLGTIAYAAPEQLEGREDLDTRADVHALGVILFEALTGELPWPVQGSTSQLVRRILQDPPRDASALEPRVDADLRAILSMALEKDPDRRYPTVEALRRDLECHLAGEAVDARRGQRFYALRTTVRRYRVPLAIAGAFLLVTTALSLVLARQTALLAREKGRLSRALHEESLQQGISLVMAQSHAAAAPVLWREHLREESEQTRWALWRLYLDQPCLATWKAHEGNVFRLAFSPDGSSLVTGGEDGDVARWSLTDGARLETLIGGRTPVRALCLDSTGRWLTVGRGDGLVELLDLAAGSRVCAVFLLPEAARSLAVDASGRVAAVADGRLRVFASRSAQALFELPEDAHSLAFRCGRLWAATSDHVLLIDPDIGRTLSEIPVEGESSWADWGPIGERILLGCGDEETRLMGRAPGLLLELPEGGRMGALSVDGSRAAIMLPRARPIVIASLDRPREARVTLNLSSAPNCLAFGRGGQVLGVGNRDGTVQLWDLSPERTPRVLPCEPVDPRRTQHSVCFDPAGARIAAGSGNDGKIWLWDARTGRLLATREAHADVVACVRFTADGQRLASVGHDGKGRLWSVPELAPVAEFANESAKLNWVETDPSGEDLLYSGDLGILKHWSPSGATRVLATEAWRFAAFARSPAGDLMALAASNPRPAILLLDLARGGPLVELSDPRHPIGAARCIAWNPRGDLVAVGGDDCVVRIFGLPSGEVVQRLEGHSDQVFALAFSPDGAMLASGDRTGSVWLWDTASWDGLATLPHEGPGDPEPRSVFSLSFDRTGTTLATAGAHGLVLQWDLGYYDRHIAGNRDFWVQRADPRDLAARR